MPLPPGVGEGLLLGITVLVGAFVIRRIRRRKAFTAVVSADLPQWPSTQSITATLRRQWRDTAQDLPMVELNIFGKSITACPVDTAENLATYSASAGKSIDIVLYGLCTLSEGGIRAAEHLIRDIDVVSPPDNFVCIVAVQTAVNDTFVVAETRGSRDEAWGQLPLRVYRAIVLRGTRGGDVTVDLAVPADGTPSWPGGTFVHGSVRWFCRIANA
jgi:hypothetical protein